MNVLVVGGYGAVGAAATRELASRLPSRVVVAGRDPERARRLAASTGSAGARRVDVTDVTGFERVLADDGISVVALCVEPPDVRIARACLDAGVHLVDVGASWPLLEQVEQLADLAADRGATAVLSVGVAPGLTNLLARRAVDELGGADRVELAVLLGAGERHGVDAVRWTVAGLAEPTAAGARPQRVALPGFGTRTVHPFPFSDQHSLRRTLGVPDVTTRLALDVRSVTAALFGLRRVLRPVARHSRGARLLTTALGGVHLGGDRFAVRADALRGTRRATYALSGREQSRITGLVAAYVATWLLDGGASPGVHHIDELPELADLPGTLAAHGVTLTIGPS
jgi:saccharopine dehydrogenase-like NADP-dependent oxidoreductase